LVKELTMHNQIQYWRDILVIEVHAALPDTVLAGQSRYRSSLSTTRYSTGETP